MAHLHAVHARPGEFSFSLEEVIAAARTWLSGREEAFRLFERFLRATGTRERRYACSLEEILSIGGQQSRSEVFTERGEPLAEQVITATLSSAGLTSADIDAVILTSCTAPLIPALDAALLLRMGFRNTVMRVPVYQYSCAGGVAGLALAHRLADVGGNVLLLSVELCSLLFRLNESSPVHLLGSALFADGSAAAVLKKNGSRMEILGAQSYLLPNTTHLMGYNIRDDGNHLRLEKELPDVLEANIAPLVHEFLAKQLLSVAEIPWWIIQPGGMKILEGMQQIFSLGPSQCQ